MSETKTHPDQLLLDIASVGRLTDLSRRTIYRLVSQGKFPRPKQLPTGGRRWTRGSILKWAERLPDAEGTDRE